MNETTLQDNAAGAAWSSTDHRDHVSQTASLPTAMSAAENAVDLLNQAVQRAHDTLDRMADRAKPAVRQIGERVSAADDSLHAVAGQWRETGDQWVEGARATVRRSPLFCVSAALAAGALIARIVR